MRTVWRDRLLIASPFLIAGVLAVYTPSDEGPTFCPFALTTGIAGPGCGMTRAVSYLIKGDLATALTYHPLVLLIVAEAIAGWVWFLLRRSGKVRPMPLAVLNLALIATAVALVAVWAVRLASGPLPPV